MKRKVGFFSPVFLGKGYRVSCNQHHLDVISFQEAEGLVKDHPEFPGDPELWC